MVENTCSVNGHYQFMSNLISKITTWIPTCLELDSIGIYPLLVQLVIYAYK